MDDNFIKSVDENNWKSKRIIPVKHQVYPKSNPIIKFLYENKITLIFSFLIMLISFGYKYDNNNILMIGTFFLFFIIGLVLSLAFFCEDLE